jgi:beta-galactosidase
VNVTIKTIFLALTLCAAPLIQAQALSPETAHTFAAQGDHFALDGKPFQVISGEMHYTRIPRPYWRARLRMARAMGLNTVTTYVFWNEHEPRPDVFDFSGQKDVAEFIHEAQEEGLYVILRPGPYVCAEWEWGGYPAWLLKDHALVVRSSDPKFMDPARRWLNRLGQELAPLQIGNGGPIILTQVENEYGSYGKDHEYMEQVHQALIAAGFTQSQLYTADGPVQVPDGSLPELPVGINFGGNKAGAAEKAFKTLRQTRSEGPSFNSEFWAGWFDHWGGPHAHTDASLEAGNLQWMLSKGYSVSIYMFHGGTSFGWMNGANATKTSYEPDTTSYNYDAPLDESGRPTKKYFLFRDLIARTTGVTPPPVPVVEAPIATSAASLTLAASLWNNLPRPISTLRILSMEDIGQAYGYILYRAYLSESGGGELLLDQLHSYATVYLNGKFVGSLDRRLQQDHLTLPATTSNERLDILVENTGRVNFGPLLPGERAGITQQVVFKGSPVIGWQIYSLPLDSVQGMHFSADPCEGPCFYQGTLELRKVGDTFLDTSNYKKGALWLNDRLLGRIWDVGPQKTLYAPASWLKSGSNEIVVLDLFGRGAGGQVLGLDHPVFSEDKR